MDNYDDVLLEDEFIYEYAIAHYGTPQPFDGSEHGSGRYRKGSGDEPFQKSTGFLGRVNQLKKEGLSEKEIADACGMSINQLRAAKTSSKAAIKAYETKRAIELKNHGYSNSEIARRLYGDSSKESTVRNLLNPVLQERASINDNVKDVLRKNVTEKRFIDVGAGVERGIDISSEANQHIGISQDRLRKCVQQLKDEEGYEVYNIDIKQMGTNKNTTIKVLCPPGTSYGDAVANKYDIQSINNYFVDNGRTAFDIQEPKSIDSSRVTVRYAEDGGKDMDGVIELRRGVNDISLGTSNYAQVRIAVDGTHYLKGMAMYSDTLPEGIDIRFNTNKSSDVPMLGPKDNTVLKVLKKDKDNPFGATIKQGGQRYYEDPNGEFVLIDNPNGTNRFTKDDGTHADSKHYSLSVINKVNEEGDWGEWSKTISSQMLSKQPLKLIEKQLDLSFAEKMDQYAEINSLTVPEIKRKMLIDFADGCDAAAVELKAAGFPGQASHVILPVPDLPPTEIYAPKYENGTQVVLIRYPHASTSEIPTLTVNNNHPSASKLLGNAVDAVGINAKVAERLSGADFDGDSVQVIPLSSKVKISTQPQLEGLKNFDHLELYKKYEGMEIISPRRKQQEMGSVSNLITDMTLKGAPPEDIERAIKHSMVIIDAEKHELNWKQSEIDNGIAELKTKYQGGPNRGASTLISRASSEIRVDPRKEGADVVDPETGKKKRIYIDPETGKKRYTTNESSYTSYTGWTIDNSTGKKVKGSEVTLYMRKKDPKTGEVLEEPTLFDKKGNKYVGPFKASEKKRTETSTKMAETDDAKTLSSGHPKEEAYANYANKLKALANQARLDYLAIDISKRNPEAAKVYKDAIDILESKLDKALQNAPRERQAQIIANSVLISKKAENPDMDAAEEKKIRGQALAAARAKVGAKKERIDISDREWEAIMAGAISSSKLTQIIDNSDLDKLKERAMPRSSTTIPKSKQGLIRSMNNSGYTIEQIAKRLDVSPSVVSKYMLKDRDSGKEG